MIQFFKTRLCEKKQLTCDVVELIFELIEPTQIEFQAGQFMMLQVPVEGSFPQKRAYSIASAPFDSNKLRFCVKFVEGGCASTFLKNLKVGEEVTFQGPFGRFVVDMNKKKNLLFIGTGTGIAPFYGILEDLFAKDFDQRIELYFGLRFEQDIFYKEVLDKFAEEHPNFSYTLTLSKPSENYTGLKGRVTDYVKAENYKPENTELYLCGSGAMVTEIKQNFLKSGFEKTLIHEELFYV